MRFPQQAARDTWRHFSGIRHPALFCVPKKAEADRKGQPPLSNQPICCLRRANFWRACSISGMGAALVVYQPIWFIWSNTVYWF